MNEVFISCCENKIVSVWQYMKFSLLVVRIGLSVCGSIAKWNILNIYVAYTNVITFLYVALNRSYNVKSWLKVKNAS